MINRVVLILATFLVSSCSTKQVPADVQTVYLQDATLQNKLFGTWGIYVETRNGTDMQCNTCPDILFLDRRALISMSGEPKDTLTYEVLSDTITINHLTDRPESNFIENGQYRMIFVRQTEFLELTLKHLQMDLEYTLRH